MKQTTADKAAAAASLYRAVLYCLTMAPRQRKNQYRRDYNEAKLVLVKHMNDLNAEVASEFRW